MTVLTPTNVGLRAAVVQFGDRDLQYVHISCMKTCFDIGSSATITADLWIGRTIACARPRFERATGTIGSNEQFEWLSRVVRRGPWLCSIFHCGSAHHDALDVAPQHVQHRPPLGKVGQRTVATTQPALYVEYVAAGPVGKASKCRPCLAIPSTPMMTSQMCVRSERDIEPYARSLGRMGPSIRCKADKRSPQADGQIRNVLQIDVRVREVLLFGDW